MWFIAGLRNGSALAEDLIPRLDLSVSRNALGSMFTCHSKAVWISGYRPEKSICGKSISELDAASIYEPSLNRRTSARFSAGS